MRFDVITFGSAALDALVVSPKIEIIKKRKRRGVFLPFGEKIEGGRVYFRSGGGGTNAAVTFANQRLKVAYCGMLGKDLAGLFVLEDLKKYKVDTKFILQTKKRPTNCSIIFTGKEGRVVLVYRGASRFLKIKDISLERLNAKWFYLAPLSGFLRKDFLEIIDFAKEKGIKVAMNPSKYQLEIPQIKDVLKKVNILILNQEEASFLARIPFQKEREVFQKIDEWVKGIVIITKGNNGVLVSDGKFLYQAPVLKTKIIDETGAGDAFGSGFVAEYIKSGDIKKAIQFATANAAAKLRKIGAKEGILKNGQKFRKVKIIKIPLNET